MAAIGTLPVLLGVGIHASRPAASGVGKGGLYSCTTHSLVYQTDGSSWTTWANLSGTGETVATSTIWDAAGDLAVGTGADTGAKLTKGAAATVLVSGASTVSWVDVLPWHVSIVPMIWTPDATTGTWGLTGFSDASTVYPFVKTGSTPNESATALFNSSTAQNDAVAWDVILAAGTWDAHFYARKASNTGIITLNQDGVSAGTVDTYAASGTYAKVSITGWTVSTTGKKRMQILMATKNASSSGYIGELFAIEFRRTA